jgi:hypothetical protein
MNGNPPTLPARAVPLLYFGFAHACLAVALAATAAMPTSVTGFYYHPGMVALVHLVTLGWITGSVLGAVYLVAPLAFRARLPARGRDLVAFFAYATGVVGMTSHFWVDSMPGMAWSAGLVLAAMSFGITRAIRAFALAIVPREVKLHILLALANLLAAATFGVLLGIHKVAPFLPGFALSNVIAHAHLAGAGFATLIVMGAGYRMLPMILPAAMPSGGWVVAGGVLVEIGVVGLFVALASGGRWAGVFAVVIVAGLAVFFSRVLWMLRHRRPAPKERPRPDFASAHALQALLYLAVACAMGTFLAWAPASTLAVRLAPAYGAAALVGFLSQIVVAVEARLLPLAAWLWSYADAGFKEMPPSLYAVNTQSPDAVVFALWTLGVPTLAAGFGLQHAALLRAGAGALFAAVVIVSAKHAWLLRRLQRPALGA